MSPTPYYNPYAARQQQMKRILLSLIYARSAQAKRQQQGRKKAPDKTEGLVKKGAEKIGKRAVKKGAEYALDALGLTSPVVATPASGGLGSASLSEMLPSMFSNISAPQTATAALPKGYAVLDGVSKGLAAPEVVSAARTGMSAAAPAAQGLSSALAPAGSQGIGLGAAVPNMGGAAAPSSGSLLGVGAAPWALGVGGLMMAAAPHLGKPLRKLMNNKKRPTRGKSMDELLEHQSFDKQLPGFEGLSREQKEQLISLAASKHLITSPDRYEDDRRHQKQREGGYGAYAGTGESSFSPKIRYTQDQIERLAAKDPDKARSRYGHVPMGHMRNPNQKTLFEDASLEDKLAMYREDFGEGRTTRRMQELIDLKNSFNQPEDDDMGRGRRARRGGYDPESGRLAGGGSDKMFRPQGLGDLKDALGGSDMVGRLPRGTDMDSVRPIGPRRPGDPNRTTMDAFFKPGESPLGERFDFDTPRWRDTGKKPKPRDIDPGFDGIRDMMWRYDRDGDGDVSNNLGLGDLLRRPKKPGYGKPPRMTMDDIANNFFSDGPKRPAPQRQDAMQRFKPGEGRDFMDSDLGRQIADLFKRRG